MSLRVRVSFVILLLLMPALALAILRAEGRRAQEIDRALQSLEQLAGHGREILQRQEAETAGFLMRLSQLPEVQQALQNPTACAQRLAELRALFPRYVNLGVADQAGDIRCSAVPPPGPVNVADRRWFQRALETAAFSVGEYQIGRITGKPVLVFGVPLLQPSGEIWGVLFAAIELQELNELLALFPLPSGAWSAILDVQGTILARWPEGEPSPGTRFPESFVISAARSGEPGRPIHQGPDGQPWIALIMPVRPGELTLVVEIPTRTLFAEANRTLQGDLAVLGGLLALLLTGAYIGTEWAVRRPIRKLIDAASQLVAGDSQALHLLSELRGKEFGALAGAFRQMVTTMECHASRQRALTSLFLRMAHAQPQLQQMLEVGLETLLEALGLSWGWMEFRPRLEGSPLRAHRGWSVSLPLDFRETLQASGLPLERFWWFPDGQAIPSPLAVVLETAGICSVAYLPLMREGQWAGGLLVGTREPRAWSEEERWFLEAAAQAVGLVLERAALHEAAARQAEELAFLNRLALQANRARDLHELLTTAIRELVTVMRADRGAIALITPSGKHLTVVAEYNPIGTPSGLGERIPIEGNPSMAWILQEQRPLAIEDVATDPRIAPVRSLLERVHVRSVLIVPLWMGNWIVGTLGIDHVRERHAFTLEEIRLAETAAHQLADALKRFRMIRILQAQADRLHVLYQTARALAELQDLPTLLSRALDEILTHLPADGASVYVTDDADPEQLRLIIEKGYSAAPIIRASAQEAEETITGRVAARGEPLWVEDCARYPYPPASRQIVEREGIRSHAALPLQRGEERLGVLHVIWRKRRTFDSETQDLLESLADLLAAGIASARLVEALRQTVAQREALNRTLEEALAAREQMIQNVSHELRTPLAVAMGYLDLLLDGAFGSLTPDQREALQASRSRLGELHRYVELLLTLQIVRGGKFTRQPLDLRQLIQTVTRMTQLRLDPERHRLELRLPSEAVWAVGEAEGLARAIGELLDNAVKFSPNGGWIEVELRTEGGTARILVRDEGVGIPEEAAERVGEPFYQVDGGTTRRFGGMGIGLAVARAVAEAHGGRLRLRPRFPRGTEAMLEIPLGGI
ncbi:GAF domain-containing protein [Thermoflexus sp.]|uniref:GAF domain-containing protein n=1 Tax=Thermoflexus sp. TaxID=1969742 RepID=UPI002ADE2961|nr:GAF domain-containing protein [Thermoflexus sp.]